MFECNTAFWGSIMVDDHWLCTKWHEIDLKSPRVAQRGVIHFRFGHRNARGCVSEEDEISLGTIAICRAIGGHFANIPLELYITIQIKVFNPNIYPKITIWPPNWIAINTCDLGGFVKIYWGNDDPTPLMLATSPSPAAVRLPWAFLETRPRPRLYGDAPVAASNLLGVVCVE